MTYLFVPLKYNDNFYDIMFFYSLFLFLLYSCVKDLVVIATLYV